MLSEGCLGREARDEVGTGQRHAGVALVGQLESIQSAAYVLGLRVSEFVREPFKGRVFVSHKSSLALLYVSPTGFQSQTLWGLIFLMQVPWPGVTNVGLEPLAL